MRRAPRSRSYGTEIVAAPTIRSATALPRSPRNLSRTFPPSDTPASSDGRRRDARAARGRARTRDRRFRPSDRSAARDWARRRNRERSEDRPPTRAAPPRQKSRRRSANGSFLRVREERRAAARPTGASRRWMSTKSPSGVSHRSTRVGSGGRGRKNFPQSVCAWPPGTHHAGR